MSIQINLESAPSPRGPSIDKIEKFGWTVVDRPGNFQMVPKNSLAVDHTYQRDLDQGKAIKMARAWSWASCGAIIVGRRPDRSLVVIDGQHRVAAALRRSDISVLPCLVFDVGRKTEEAKSFYEVNTGRKAMNVYFKYRAALAFEDKAAVFATNLINESGYYITRSENVKPNDTRSIVTCIGSVMAKAESEPEVLSKAWELIHQVHRGLPIRKTAFEPLFYLYKNTDGRIFEKSHRDRLMTLGPDAIIRAANEAVRYYEKHGARVQALGVLKLINKNRRIEAHLRLNEEAEDED